MTDTSSHDHPRSLSFRPHRRSDIPLRVRWFSDPKVHRYIGTYADRRTTTHEQEAWFDGYRRDRTKRFFTIMIDNKPIGIIGLSHIDRKHMHAELFIAIGETLQWGKGYGRAAITWILRYGFETLGLHKISIAVMAKNSRALRAYRAVGFRVEGRLRDEERINGAYHDIVLMTKFAP